MASVITNSDHGLVLWYKIKAKQGKKENMEKIVLTKTIKINIITRYWIFSKLVRASKLLYLKCMKNKTFDT